MTARDDAENIEVDGEDYVSFGYLDPLIGRRIMDRLSRNQVRFIARDASRLGVASAGIIDYVSWRDPYRVRARINRIELLIHSEDQDTARKVIDET
ncbi:MAG TPA: hypothetical protein VGQ95_08970 [Chthoniobacterales bacterium]|nr:hypothetical protein [Chthoniobacterales bacterium]